MSYVQSITGRRDGGRLRLGLKGSFDLVSGCKSCEVVDLSVWGARLRMNIPPRAGVWGVLVVDELDVFGRVVWRRERLCGVNFDEPISNEQLLDFRIRGEQLYEEQLARERNAPAEYARTWVEGG